MTSQELFKIAKELRRRHIRYKKFVPTMFIMSQEASEEYSRDNCGISYPIMVNGMFGAVDKNLNGHTYYCE